MGCLPMPKRPLTLDWFSGVPSGDVTITIDVGDLVEWTWADTLLSHLWPMMRAPKKLST